MCNQTIEHKWNCKLNYTIAWSSGSLSMELYFTVANRTKLTQNRSKFNFTSTEVVGIVVYIVCIGLKPSFQQNLYVTTTNEKLYMHTYGNTVNKGWLTLRHKQRGKYNITPYLRKKNKQNYFCYNYVKLPPNMIIFGTKMANGPKIIWGALIFHLI